MPALRSVVADDCVELEIALEHSGATIEDPNRELFTAQVRVSRPDSEAEDRLTRDGLAFDHARLRELELDPVAYGQMLTDVLFSDDLRAAYERARGAAGRLRIRLSFGPTASALQHLRWETLRDPDIQGAPLLQDHRILFSRFLSSFDWRPVRLRPRESLRALVVIANPANLAAKGLAPIRAAEELQRARTNLGLHDGAVASLVSAPANTSPVRVTLDRLLEALRDGPDILYLVCHGRVGPQGVAALCLEDADGQMVAIKSDDLVQRLADLEQRPRLVVLASCESAGPEGDSLSIDGSPFLAIGPRLAEAGIPAVLAMQGRVLMRTVAEFMPCFFRELALDGVVDRAVAVARGAISDPGEAWRPTLFMRLKRGRLWYQAGFGDGRLKNWQAIQQKIQMQECTPIIGPGLLDTLYEYRPQFARRWAQKWFFPMAPAQYADLTAVAQFLATEEGANFPHNKLITDLVADFAMRLGQTVPDGMTPEEASLLLERLLIAYRSVRFAGRRDPYQILADLSLPVYLLASPDPLLVTALREREYNGVRKAPQIGVLPWNPRVRDPLAERKNFRPTPAEPLVYYLFGRFDQPDSLVLTEDDYFDFLLNIQKPDIHTRIPRQVLARLSDSSLLFLGLQMETWEFRAVFRTIMQQEGHSGLDRHPHVAAQIEPEEGRVLDPGRAHAYLEDYFKWSRNNGIYWGTIEQFLDDLDAQRKTRTDGHP